MRRMIRGPVATALCMLIVASGVWWWCKVRRAAAAEGLRPVEVQPHGNTEVARPCEPLASGRRVSLVPTIMVAVVDTLRRPLCNAEVRVAPTTTSKPKAWTRRATDSSGTAEFGLDPSGDSAFWIIAEKDGFAPAIEVWNNLNAVAGEQSSSTIQLLELCRNVVSVASVLDGAPIAGADVNAIGRWGRDAEQVLGSESRSVDALIPRAITDESGVAILYSVPHVPYLVHVAKSGYLPLTSSLSPSGARDRRQTCQLEPVEYAGVEFRDSEAPFSPEIQIEYEDSTSKPRTPPWGVADQVVSEELNRRFGGENTVFWLRLVSSTRLPGTDSLKLRCRSPYFLSDRTSELRFSSLERLERANISVVSLRLTPEERLRLGSVSLRFLDRIGGRPVSLGWSLNRVLDGVGSSAVGGVVVRGSDIAAGEKLFVPEGDYDVELDDKFLTALLMTETPEVLRVSVQAQRDTRCEVVLPSSWSQISSHIVADVRDQLTRPVTRCELALLSNSPRIGLTRFFGIDALAQRSILPGEYLLMVHSIGYAPFEMPISVPSGESMHIAIGLVPSEALDVCDEQR